MIFGIICMSHIDSYLSWSYSSESEPQSRNMSTCPSLAKVQNSKSSPSTLHWLLFAQRALIWILAWVCNSLRSWSMLCLLWATIWQLIMSEANRFFGDAHHTAKVKTAPLDFFWSASSGCFTVCPWHWGFANIGSFSKPAASAKTIRRQSRCDDVRWVWVKMLRPSWTHKKLMMFSITIWLFNIAMENNHF